LEQYRADWHAEQYSSGDATALHTVQLLGIGMITVGVLEWGVMGMENLDEMLRLDRWDDACPSLLEQGIAMVGGSFEIFS
jgi:hypothetical protein